MGRGRIHAAVVLVLTLLVLLPPPIQAQAGCNPSFPQGDASFADEVTDFARGTFGTSGQPNNALGPQNAPNASVTLGNGGTITIRFTDNVLTGSGNGDPDLYVFESGPLQELVTVEISSNGTDFASVGQTTGQCGFIDIDAFGFGPGDQFVFVRVTDIFDDQFRENSSAGAEINAIGAITTAVLDPPNAQNDNYTTDEDTPLSVGAGEGLLDNDSDPNGEDIAVVDFTQPANGAVTVNPNGSFDYTPDPDFAGTDTFEYTIENESGLRDTATVTITVNAENEPPSARDDEATTTQGDPVKIDVLRNDDDPDGDSLEITDVTQPDGGTVEITDDGQIRFTPDPGFTGHARFTYTVDDGNGGTDTAEVVVNVQEKNDPLKTEDDRYDAKQDQPKDVDNPGVLKNDEDPDGDNLTASVDEQPANGHVDMKDNGGFTYTPDPGFHGGDEFTYWAKDGNGNRSKGRATIRVEQAKEDEPGLAVSGDGGVSTTNADGGAVVIDNANTGENAGDAAAIEETAVEAPMADPASDSDGDGLSFEEERKAYGTDPWAWDSDGDGLGDGDEILVSGTNPLAPEPAAEEQPAAPEEQAPVVETVVDPTLTDAPAVEPVIDPAARADVATLVMGCAAFPGWLDAQSAYEAAGRTGADANIVDVIDSDWDGIACEEMMP